MADDVLKLGRLVSDEKKKKPKEKKRHSQKTVGQFHDTASEFCGIYDQRRGK